MEVHAHTHTERKKFTHYFWEFFMLFLAVFAGFLAENQREHMINKNFEKKFIVSLIQDLERDTARLNTVLKWRERRVNFFDSLIILLHHPKPETQSALIYHYGRIGYRTTIFTPSNQTYENIKNSGSLRIIHSLQAADSIGRYYTAVSNLNNNTEDFNKEVILQYRSIANEIFDGRVLYQMDSANLGMLGAITEIEATPLMTTDKKILNKLSVEAYSLSFSNKILYIQYLDLKNRAMRLIPFLKKEYHLK